jgi:hypothetical protein
MAEPAATDSELPQGSARMAKVLQGLGHCITIYQKIELHLKFLLPHVVTPGKPPPVDSIREWRSLLDSTTTLGPLMKTLANSVSADDPEDFAKYLDTVVQHRNDLVHHFYSQAFGNLQTAEDFEFAYVYLRTRMQFAMPLWKSLQSVSAQVSTALVESLDQVEARESQLRSKKKSQLQ